MADLSKIYLYRMTHIENVPHIIAHGITHKDSAASNPSFTPIGDPTLITARNGFVLDNGRALGEYIPFSAIRGFIVYNKDAERKLKAMGVDEKIVHIHGKSYF